MPDDLSATLAGILERISSASTYDDWHRVARDARAAVAALDAVLKPHQPGPVTIFGSLCKRHENHRYFSVTVIEAEDVRACPDCEATVYSSCSGCGHPVPVGACPVRAAITAELAGTGKEGSDE